MDKNETTQLKGIAVMFMFWHHLFGCGNFLMLEDNKWISCFGEYDIILGESFKICVGLFAVVSGYGLYKSYIYSRKYLTILKKIITFLMSYWTIVFSIAIPYLLLFQKFNFKWIIINLFALLHNDEILYLSFSWYVKVYLEALLFLPLVKYLDSKINIIHLDILIFIMVPLSVAMQLPESEIKFVNWEINILSSIRLLFTWYPLFHIGVIYAKYKVPEKYFRFNVKYFSLDKPFKKGICICLTIMMIVLFLFYRRQWLFNYYTDVICASIIILLFDFCYKCGSVRCLSKILYFLGRYSFQYWLISGMFYLNTTELQWILTLPRYSIFIFVWMFIVITPFAVLVGKLNGMIHNAIMKFISASNKSRTVCKFYMK